MRRTARLRIDLTILVCVIVVASAFAGTMLVRYRADPGALWTILDHDRNGHFGYAVDLTLAMRSLDAADLLNQLEKSRVWPPVHGLMLAFTMLVAGIDIRVAIVPSLIGWTATIVLTFLIARRLLTDRFSGHVAGIAAVTFAMASPAFRLLTADVMLDGLGAALTAASLFAYIRARTRADRASWGLLAIILTMLFFEKGNYWLLTVGSLGVASVAEHEAGWRRWTRERLARVSPASVIRGAVRDPLIVAAGMLLAAVFTLYAHGPTSITVAGRSVSLYPPENLVTVVYALLFARAALMWRRHRASWDRALEPVGQPLFYRMWVPIGVSFLIPKRLSAFLWYVGPTHSSGQPYHPLTAALSQWEGFSGGFHVAPWAAILVIALAGLAVSRMRRLAPDLLAVVALAVLGSMAVIVHRVQQWRFQANWVFAFWILAGVGVAIALSFVTRRWSEIARGVAAAAVIASLAVAESRQAWTSTAYAAAARAPGLPSDLELARAYLPHVRGARAVGFLSDFRPPQFFAWTIREDCRCRMPVDWPWYVPDQTAAERRTAAADWLRRTGADRIVVIEGTATSMQDLLERDGRFERTASERVLPFGLDVTTWRRAEIR